MLRAAMTTRDIETIQAVLMRTVEGYRPDMTHLSNPLPAAASLPVQSRMLH